ncbi:MAG: Gfo/Idh/MocA family oxidoreductase [bacterium]
MKVAVIGVGKMGINHARLFSRMKKVELVGVADINETLVHGVAAEFKTRAFVDYRRLLKLKPHAVSVVVPTSLHREVTLDVLDAGCHVLVEKPISVTVEDGREMIRAGHRRGLKLLVGHVERFNPAVNILKEILDDGMLGDVVSITTKRVGPYDPRVGDSGIILDLAPHDIDIISYLYGDRVKEVYAIAGQAFHTQEDHATLMLKFRRGAAGVIETSWLPPNRVRKLNVVGKFGVATLDFIEQRVVVYDKNWAREAKVEKQDSLKNELEYFVRLVQNGEQPVVTGEDSLHALSVALTAVESAATGKVLKVPYTRIPEPSAQPLKVVRDANA